jgi:folylpolyglutamate synthase/dihydropteroate synthase
MDKRDREQIAAAKAEIARQKRLIVTINNRMRQRHWRAKQRKAKA